MTIDGLVSILKQLDPYLEIKTATCMRDALPLLRSNLVSTDLVFLDLTLSDAEGFAALETVQAHSPGAAVAIVSGHEEIARIQTAYHRGARAYIPKSLGRDELIKAVEQFLVEGHWFPAKVLTPRPASSKFSNKEREIVQLVDQGLSNEAIAEKLCMSVGTVKWYMSAMYRKTGTNKRTALAAFVRKLGIVC